LARGFRISLAREPENLSIGKQPAQRPGQSNVLVRFVEVDTLYWPDAFCLRRHIRLKVGSVKAFFLSASNGTEVKTNSRQDG
jgi:hypothetical protein